ncbi:ribonuclease Z [Maribacter confluentis]|uniref:Ribonuclease Z n=1 Tax=Maribacter confluentis TaxID=1656093 RepID=A0ABT8RMP1_9FLAO|nr:ribonuclease Z [Maribacter confluentis]MDO1511722.1 ribonuclease Z [Maribacter confluentis]
MRLTILGCYAATPRTLTNPTAQVLEINGHILLLDCGEGTQVQLRKHKVKFSRINHIFISHLHGDHFFGLPGFISTMRLLGREKELHIYGPKGIKEAITLLMKLGDSWTNYPLIFHELTGIGPELIFEDAKISVTTIPLSHRIYTNGFLIKEKLAKRKLNIEAVEAYGIDIAYYRNIQNGKDIILDDGTLISNNELTYDPAPPKSYAFCSDTVYTKETAKYVKGVDVLYHESTFLESEAQLATKTKHSTAMQAAKIAKQANVKDLILGHYSTRYKSIDLFKQEAETIFANVHLADDGRVFNF